MESNALNSEHIDTSVRRISDIMQFWFSTLEPKQWYMGGTTVDSMLTEHFGDLLAPALRGELWQWRESAQGRLAEILALDQFTRNCFRGTARAFAGDAMALTLAQTAVQAGVDTGFTASEKMFLYMPFMHAESPVVHRAFRHLFQQSGLEDALKYYDEHASVVAEFGRYPSRNAALGRDSSAAEMAYLGNGKRWGQ